MAAIRDQVFVVRVCVVLVWVGLVVWAVRAGMSMPHFAIFGEGLVLTAFAFVFCLIAGFGPWALTSIALERTAMYLRGGGRRSSQNSEPVSLLLVARSWFPAIVTSAYFVVLFRWPELLGFLGRDTVPTAESYIRFCWFYVAQPLILFLLSLSFLHRSRARFDQQDAAHD